MTIMMWIFVSSLIMTNMAYAECTPTPDCASIGYTETSCETASLKCPFDTSKLKCLPCDSSFKYDCNGDNMTGSVGSACNGKYASCECGSGYIWRGNTCEEKPNCTVGMIYYSDKSCSNDLDHTKTPIGVVVKDNELIAALTMPDIPWGEYNVDISGLTNITSSSTAKSDMNGKNKTAIIVAAHIEAGLTSSDSAAMYCNEHSTAVTNAGDWYLPAAGELYNYLYMNYTTIKVIFNSLGITLSTDYFWSSSESGSSFVWLVQPSTGYVDTDYAKNNNFPIVCFHAIN